VQRRTPVFGTTGILVALGLVFGDIGTSPLYVLRAATELRQISEELILQILSLIFWIITLIASVKYVSFVINVDNQGEGGILALYSLVKRRFKWVLFLALIGLAALVAEAVITPAISILAAVEGLKIIDPNIQTTSIAFVLIIFLFTLQGWGSQVVGTILGPIILIWFSFIGFVGLVHVIESPFVLRAINPKYAIDHILQNGFFSAEFFKSFAAVFLCITGVEALYSDVGHVGRLNLRVAWVFVKLALLLNYFGQGANLLKYKGQTLDPAFSPFYDLVPEDYILIATFISSLATVVASQAVISGVFTLGSIAVNTNLIPKLRIKYPGKFKGQVYLPQLNFILMLGCTLIVFIFQNSKNLEHLYGLSVNLSIICTTVLFTCFLIKTRRFAMATVFFVFFIFLELCFLKSNLSKFWEGAWLTLVFAAVLFTLSYAWLFGYSVNKDVRAFIELKPHLCKFEALSNDQSVPLFADNLVCLSESNIPEVIESRLIYSIFYKKPKRALTYWLIHVDIVDEPFSEKEEIFCLIPKVLYKVNFKLGFRTRINLDQRFFNLYKRLVSQGEINDLTGTPSLASLGVHRSTLFLVFKKTPLQDLELNFVQAILYSIWLILNSISEPRWKMFDIDEYLIIEESVPTDPVCF
jgi:KUP system potassium uptake protein